MMWDSPDRAVPASASAASESCSVPDGAPRITRLVPPIYSEAIRAEHRAGVVDVTVYLESDGTVAKAVVSRSSGDALLDGATYAAAIASTYAPEVKNCTYLAGSYVFRARYKADPVASDAHPATPPNVPAEPPPFPPQPAAPAALPLPLDSDDVITTYSPSSFATAAPGRGADRSAYPQLLRPVRPLPSATALAAGKAPLGRIPATPAPSPSP
jgi:TonB family protein